MLEEEQGDYDLVLAVDPTEPSNVVTGQQLYLFVSTNADTATVANVTWQRIMSWELRNEGLDGHHADLHHVVLAGNPVECWVAGDGGIARSLDWRTGAAPIHGERFLADPARPIPPGAVRWDKRDHGIGGAQFYDITQHASLPGVVAGGLQDNGTVLRPGGLTWQRIFGADGGHAVFDPDDPYRMHISYYAGPRRAAVPGAARLALPGFADRRPDVDVPLRSVSTLPDGSPFVPETERHPTRAGRLLHARDGRLWGMQAGQGERIARRAARALVRAAGLPAAAARRPRRRRHRRRSRPTSRSPTRRAPGGSGCVPGRYVRPERGGIRLPSRVPAPYRARRGRHADAARSTARRSP